MVILDATVVNIALPHVQQSLHFSATSLSWVLNGYTLTFGGLLLLGGRAGDILGRRRTFIAGIGLFTMASLAGVRPEDSGAASSMVNVMQQVGGSLGLAVLVAVFGTASRNAARHPVAGTAAQALQAAHVHGMATAFLLAAILDLATLVVIVALIRARPPMPAPRPAEEEEEVVAA